MMQVSENLGKAVFKLIKISNIMLLATLIGMLGGCSVEKPLPDDEVVEVNTLNLPENGEKIDILTTTWIAPTAEPMQEEGWEIIECVAGINKPSNIENALFVSTNKIVDNALYSLLLVDKHTKEDVLCDCEIKSTDLDSLQTESLLNSFSELDFGDVLDAEYAEKIRKNPPITAMDTDGENLYFFISPRNDNDEIEHFYKVVADMNKKVIEVTDYIDFLAGILEDMKTFYVPEIVFGKSGEVYYTDLFGKTIYYLDAKGEIITTVDAKKLVGSLQYVGKNVSGMPIWANSSGADKAEFFYIDENGRNVLYSGFMYYGTYSFDEYGNMLIANSGDLYLWNVTTGAIKLLYQFKGINGFQCTQIAPNNAKEIIVSFDDRTESYLYRISRENHPEKTEIVLLADFPDQYLECCAADYSRTHPEISIRIETFDINDEYAWQKEIDNVKKGTGPDIIYTDRKKLQNLKEAGVICPLDDYISADVRDSIVEGALKMGEIDSLLYAIPYDAYIRTLMVNKKFWDKNGWTMDEMMAEYERLRDFDNTLRFMGIYYGLDAQKLFLYLCTSRIDKTGYVDMATQTCNFKTQSFYKLLRFCRDYCDQTSISQEMFTDEECIEEMRKGNAFLYPFEGGLKEYSKTRKQLGDDFRVVGYPSSDRKICDVSESRGLALSAMSGKTNIAADFISKVVGEEYQAKYMYRAAMVSSEVISRHVRDSYFVDYADPKQEAKPAFVNDGRVVVVLEGREDGTSYADEYISIIDAGAPSSVEYEIQNIVYEESAAFFAGEKTEQETAEIIQSRVSIYLAERK